MSRHVGFAPNEVSVATRNERLVPFVTICTEVKARAETAKRAGRSALLTWKHLMNTH
jgi:hypothetical protein